MICYRTRMPQLQLRLSQADIESLIATRYGVPLSDVATTITAAYHGSQTDSSPGTVEVVVNNPTKPD